MNIITHSGSVLTAIIGEGICQRCLTLDPNKATRTTAVAAIATNPKGGLAFLCHECLVDLANEVFEAS